MTRSLESRVRGFSIVILVRLSHLVHHVKQVRLIGTFVLSVFVYITSRSKRRRGKKTRELKSLSLSFSVLLHVHIYAQRESNTQRNLPKSIETSTAKDDVSKKKNREIEKKATKINSLSLSLPLYI